MNPSQVKLTIAARHKARINRPILLESSPGIGKTEIAAQCASELGIGFMAIHSPLLQPEDYAFPIVSADRRTVNFIVSREKFPLVESDCPDEGILLFDELAQCDNSTQKIISTVIHEKQIHGQKLKPNWSVVATGNKTTDRAGANRLLSHLGNRVTRIELEASLDDWTQWALSNSVKPEVIGFIRLRPDLLSHFDPQSEVNPTPRSWSQGVSAVLGVIPSAHEFQTFKGDVGEGPAAEFCSFLKMFRELPSIDAIIVNPTGSVVPTGPAILYAVSCALSQRTTPDNFGRIMQYVKRMPSEFGVVYIRDAIRKCPTIQTSKDFITWASGDGAKLLA